MTRNDDEIRVRNVSNACQQKYPTWQDAIKAYTESYNNGEVIAYPEPNTRWWTDPIPVRNTSELAADTSTSSEEALWATFVDEDTAARAELVQRLNHLTL